MAGKRRSETYDEFIVDKGDVGKVDPKKHKIEHMYSVEIIYGQEIDGKRWIRLNGEHGDRKCAKEYILAICHPQETLKYQYPPIFDSKFNSAELLEDIEKRNCAVVEKCLNGSQLLIMGSSVSVTLAWSRIEMLIKSNNTNSCTTSLSDRPGSQTRLDSNLQRALSQHSDGDSIHSIHSVKEYSNVNNSVKGVILKTLTRMANSDEEDINESDLFASGPDQAKSYAIPIFMTDSDLTTKVVADAVEEHDEQSVSSKQIKSEGLKGSTSGVGSRSRKQSYMVEIGRSSGYDEAFIEKALYYVTDDTKTDEFLNILKVISNTGSKKGDDGITLVNDNHHEKDNSEAFPLCNINSVVSDSGKLKGRDLPSEYIMRLLDEEETGLTVDELKRKNEERQQILKSQITPQSKEPASSKKKKKRNKQSGKSETVESSRKDRIFLTNPGEEQNLKHCVQGLKVCDIVDSTPAHSSKDDCDRLVVGAKSSPTKLVNNTLVDTSNPNLFYLTNTVQNVVPDSLLKQNHQHMNVDMSNYPPTTHQLSKFSQSPKNSYEKSYNVTHGISQQSPLQQTSRNQSSPCSNKIDEETCVMKIWRHEVTETSSSPRKQSSKSPARSKKNVPHSPRRKIAAVPPTVIGKQFAERERHLSDEYDLRYVVVDGSNVAMTHGNGQVFSCMGLKLCVDFFLKRGHNVTVFVPEWRKYTPGYRNQIMDQEILHDLKDSGHLVFTPSRKVKGKLIVSYDDRYILQLAEEEQGVIVSNDNYRDLMSESTTWKHIIEERLLMYAFAGNNFMPAPDPLGRDGPKLNDFLKKPKAKPFEIPEDDSDWKFLPQNEQDGYQIGTWEPEDPQNYHRNIDYYGPIGPEDVRDCEDMARGVYAITQNSPNFKQGYSQFPGNQTPIKGRGQPLNKQPQQKQQRISVSDQPLRSRAESKKIMTELKLIFPEDAQEVKIRTVLDNHRKERDISKLTNYCLNIMSNQ